MELNREQLTEIAFTLVECVACDSSRGERDNWCESCEGSGWDLSPVLSFEEFVSLLAGDEWEANRE